jgi:hypothetical protein
MLRLYEPFHACARPEAAIGFEGVTRGLVILSMLCLAAGCSVGGNGSSAPADHGGFTGKSAALYDYAYLHCYPLAKRAAAAQPPGSGPSIYPLAHSYPLAALGGTKPRGPAEWKAAKRGCALGMVTAFADAHSSETALICRVQAAWLPPATAACESGARE